MSFSATLRGERFVFADLRELFAKANEEKSGDALAGIAARSERERAAAKLALADVRLSDIITDPLVEDDVSRAILEDYDGAGFAEIRSQTVGEFRELLLADPHPARFARGVTPEIAAAAAKLMSNKDLILAASKIRNVTRLRNTLGGPGVLACRLQPNHPSDDIAGIL